LKFYPICVDLYGAKVVVIGAGRVAERKLRGLLQAGARLLVVAPEATAQISAWAKRGRICWQRRQYSAGDLRGAKFVIAATNDASLNARIARLAQRQRILINSATGRGTGDVILPAVARHGSVTIAISTSGKNPSLARRWREKLEKLI